MMWRGRHCKELGQKSKAEMAWAGTVIRRDEGDPVRDIMEPQMKRNKAYRR
jgi:hypothetical protein